MFRIGARLLSASMLLAVLVSLSGCFEVASFFPDPLRWKESERAVKKTVRAQLIEPMSEVTLTSDARTSRAQFKVLTGGSSATTCLNGKKFKSTSATENFCITELELEQSGPYTRESAELILEGEIEKPIGSNRVRVGKETSTLRTVS
jgi:hypothetical protein